MLQTSMKELDEAILNCLAIVSHSARTLGRRYASEVQTRTAAGNLGPAPGLEARLVDGDLLLKWTRPRSTLTGAKFIGTRGYCGRTDGRALLLLCPPPLRDVVADYLPIANAHIFAWEQLARFGAVLGNCGLLREMYAIPELKSLVGDCSASERYDYSRRRYSEDALGRELRVIEKALRSLSATVLAEASGFVQFCASHGIDLTEGVPRAPFGGWPTLFSIATATHSSQHLTVERQDRPTCRSISFAANCKIATAPPGSAPPRIEKQWVMKFKLQNRMSLLESSWGLLKRLECGFRQVREGPRLVIDSNGDWKQRLPAVARRQARLRELTRVAHDPLTAESIFY